MKGPHLSLVPGIEHRLTTWADLQARLAKAPAPRVRPTITLSRTFGCEGFPLAEQLREFMAAATGEPWNVYDKSLLEKVALEEGVAVELLRNLGEAARAVEFVGPMPSEYRAHLDAFGKVATTLVQLARVGNAIIVGRGGAVLCRELTNAFHFRLDARLEYRVASIARRLELPLDEARAYVVANNSLRERFINETLKTNVADLTHYDALFNNERHSVRELAQAIAAYVRSAMPDAQSSERPRL